MEHRCLYRLEHLPPDLDGHRLISVDQQPWLQHVTRAEELGGGMVADRDPSREQALDDQQPEVCDMVEIIWVKGPRPACVPSYVCHELRARDRQIVVAQVLRQLRIVLKD